MLNENQLQSFFKIKYLPVKDGDFWDGKPSSYSNLKLWALTFTQRFGQNLLDYSQFGLKGHNGIDIAFREGCPMVAPCDLWVSFTQNDVNGYGNNIFAETTTQKINGENYKLEFVFGHLKEIIAKPYRWYKTGDLLGYGDSTGFSTGHHLHFGIRPHCQLVGQDLIQMFPDNGYKGWIDPEPFLPHIVWNWEELNKPNNNLIMIIIKEKGKSALYAPVGNVLLPFATDFETYKEEFSKAIITELETKEFQKYKIADKLVITI